MNDNVDRVIELSQGKLVLLIFGGLCFAIGGSWIASWDDATIQAFRPEIDPLVIRSIGVIAALLGVAGLVSGIRKLFDKKPGLVLSTDGFTDNSSAVAAGFIPWSEVKDLSVYKVRRQKFLVIHLVTPEKYVTHSNPLRRMLNSANTSMCGSPISISSNTLKISFDELHQLFQSYISLYCAHHNPVLKK